jgi:uncharacterized lipoprotein YddW (UPF0748 family)
MIQFPVSFSTTFYHQIFLPVCQPHHISLFLGIQLLVLSTVYGQEYPPKREFRGVWIATIDNIDWPSSPSLTTEEQQQEFKDLLAFHKRSGINAVIVQIRPCADALYQSSYEPWSRWLTGKEGKAPDPVYDPLEFMISECRQQQIEFHAWINPFRAIFNHQEAEISEKHIFFQHPQWIVPYGKHSYFDPGLPEVREYLLDVVMDVVNRYDIDGIHFDDYFYPYRVDSLRFLDNITYSRYGADFKEVDDWRRDNINQFISAVHDSIEAIKPQVRFGVSPFGVWRNQDIDPTGSDSQADQTSYDDLYADVLTWLKNGWIDYVAPQLYFGIGYEKADYRKLLDWWVNNTYGRQLYIGHAAYKVGVAEDSLWNNPSQIANQIALNRLSFQVDGSVFFSSRSFVNNPLGINEHLRSNIYQFPALVPAMSWQEEDAPDPPYELAIARNQSQVLIQWNQDVHQDVCYYVVYGTEGEEPPNISDPTTIIAKTFYPKLSFREADRKGFFRKAHTFVVTAVNRNHNESVPSQPVQIRLFGN